VFDAPLLKVKVPERAAERKIKNGDVGGSQNKRQFSSIVRKESTLIIQPEEEGEKKEESRKKLNLSKSRTT